ncbi:MAG: hypothetical protein J7J75_04285, partial [Euryarchaeota archaeon]|nr:hypothetical protein [Euryarchaeota archaeon]
MGPSASSFLISGNCLGHNITIMLLTPCLKAFFGTLVWYVITMKLIRRAKFACPTGALILANCHIPIGQKKKRLCVLCVSVV